MVATAAGMVAEKDRVRVRVKVRVKAMVRVAPDWAMSPQEKETLTPYGHLFLRVTNSGALLSVRV